MKTIAEIVKYADVKEISKLFYTTENFKPATSWNDIVEYAADVFAAYAEDESSVENGKTISDRYNDGELTEGNVMDAFKEFCAWRWASEFEEE